MVRLLQEVLGHANLNTLARYTPIVDARNSALGSLGGGMTKSFAQGTAAAKSALSRGRRRPGP